MKSWIWQQFIGKNTSQEFSRTTMDDHLSFIDFFCVFHWDVHLHSLYIYTQRVHAVPSNSFEISLGTNIALQVALSLTMILLKVEVATLLTSARCSPQQSPHHCRRCQMLMYAYTYIYIDTCKCVSVYVYLYIYIYRYTYIYVYIRRNIFSRLVSTYNYHHAPPWINYPHFAWPAWTIVFQVGINQNSFKANQLIRDPPCHSRAICPEWKGRGLEQLVQEEKHLSWFCVILHLQHCLEEKNRNFTRVRSVQDDHLECCEAHHAHQDTIFL